MQLVNLEPRHSWALATVLCPGKGLKQGMKVNRGECAWDWVEERCEDEVGGPVRFALLGGGFSPGCDFIGCRLPILNSSPALSLPQ